MSALATEHDIASSLLESAGHFHTPFELQPMQGGRNNRVHRLITLTGGSFLLKTYFHHPQDPRDRLATETAFLRYLVNADCAFAPRCLATEPAAHAALLEFIDGRPFTLGAISERDVDLAAAFFNEANSARHTASALALNPASEACFSISQHLEKTQRRIDRLSQISPTDDVDQQAERFVHSELLPQWQHVRAEILRRWPSDSARCAALPSSERCLSPSDFGFHNALRTSDGRVRFLDFEYAGWDDPAKLVCDFANQPDLLLPRELSARFRHAVIAANAQPDALSARIDALEPLYQIKWACICLNDFLASGRTRLQFTEGVAADPLTRRIQQLVRSRHMLGLAAATSAHS